MCKSMRQAIQRMATLVVLAIVTLSFTPAWAMASDQTATVDARIRVFQKYDVSTSGLQSSFEYLIVPQEEDAPLPNGANGQPSDTFTLTRNEELWLIIPVLVEASPQARSYTYHYELRPKALTLSGGLYYVDVLSTNLARGANVYYLEVFVQGSSENPADARVVPLVHVEGWDGPKVTDPGWRVSYQKKDSHDDSNSNADSNSTNNSTSNTTGDRDLVTGSSVNDDKASTTAGTSSTSTRLSSDSKTPLSQTGDIVDVRMALQCFIVAVGLVVSGVLIRRWKAGDGHA